MARLHKVTVEEVKALYAAANMPMSKCAKVLREKAKDSYIEDLEKENAKLWELVRYYEHCTMHADCSRCEYYGKISTHCPLSLYFPDIDELRELGIEVE